MKNCDINIAYIHTGKLLDNTPSSTFVLYNAIGLSKVFSKVYLYTRKKSNAISEAELNKIFSISKPANLIIEEFSSNLGKISNSLYYIKVYQEIKKKCIEYEIHALITRRNTFLPYLLKLKKKFDIPIYFEAHDFFANLSLRSDINKNKKYEKIEKKYIPKLSGVFCLQNAQKKIYEKEFPNQKFYVLRTGIHKIQNNIGISNDLKYVGYIGSLDTHKGVENILKAASISKTKPHIMIIGGKNQNEIEEFKIIIKKYYKIEKVKITGWVSKLEMKKFIGLIKIGIIPLQNTFFNRYLTSPLKLFDFFSYGIPIISSDLPAMRELIDENETGIFFKSGNAEDLAEKIDYIFENDATYHKMRKLVFSKAKQLFWKQRALSIYEIIKNDK